jgi:hypothetical protein
MLMQLICPRKPIPTQSIDTEKENVLMSETQALSIMSSSALIRINGVPPILPSKAYSYIEAMRAVNLARSTFSNDRGGGVNREIMFQAAASS